MVAQRMSPIPTVEAGCDSTGGTDGNISRRLFCGRRESFLQSWYLLLQRLWLDRL